MRISPEELKSCEIDRLIGKIVTVVCGPTPRIMGDIEEFHEYFTGKVVQENHLGVWLVGQRGKRAFFFWHAVQAVCEETPIDPEGEEAKNLFAKAEAASKKAAQQPIKAPTIPAWAGRPQPQRPQQELVQLSFDKLKERAAAKAAEAGGDAAPKA